MSGREMRAVAFCFAAISSVVAGLLLLGPVRDVLLRFTHDDAFYYFGIARRWSRQGFPTFDGIDATNGYHPLWQWLLVAVSRFFPDPITFVRVGAASGVVFFGLATWIVVKRLTREGNQSGALAYAWVAGTLLLATIYGMESPLAVMLLAVGISATPHRDEWQWSQTLLCGAATALLFLARLDALVWIVALDTVLAFAAWRTNRGRILRLVALMVAIHLIVVGGYFLGNWLSWGHVLSISAALKAARASLFSLAVPRSLLLMLAIVVSAAGIPLLVEFCLAIRNESPDQVWTLATPAWLGLANAMYLATIVAKGDYETYNWYFALTVFSGAYLWPVCLERYGTTWTGISRRALTRVGLVACVALVVLSVRSKITQPSGFLGAYDQATTLASFREDSLVLGASDCGILGYFSHQRVINMDGLTNSWDFQQALAEHRLAPWLTDRGLNTYVTHATIDRDGAVLHARAGLSSPSQTLHLQVEPISSVSAPATGEIAVWRVTMIEHPSN